eukprot:365394-Chlamydomonas_euryale.AAC.6
MRIALACCRRACTPQRRAARYARSRTFICPFTTYSSSLGRWDSALAGYCAEDDAGDVAARARWRERSCRLRASPVPERSHSSVL